MWQWEQMTHGNQKEYVLKMIGTTSRGTISTRTLQHNVLQFHWGGTRLGPASAPRTTALVEGEFYGTCN